MRERVRDAFDQITADEALKEQTRAFLAQERRKAAPTRRPIRRMAAVLVCLMCLLVGVGGWAYLTPTSAISIESSAALELEVNRFDRVVAVRGADDAGCVLAQTLDLQHLPYQQAMQIVLDQQADDGEPVSIGVTGSNDSQCQAILQQAQTCTNGQAACYAADAKTLEQAREAGLPLGKYRMLLTLQQLDPDLTAEDVQGMRMSELRRLQAALSGEEDTTGQNGGPGNGAGAQSGQNGTGAGNGAGQNGNGTGAGNGNGQNGNGNGTGSGNGMGHGAGPGSGNGAKHDQSGQG